MKKIANVSLLIFILLAPAATFPATRKSRVLATCTGSTPCRACKNCRYCKHCAKEGGRCGVCKRSRVAPRQASWEEARRRLTLQSTLRIEQSATSDLLGFHRDKQDIDLTLLSNVIYKVIYK